MKENREKNELFQSAHIVILESYTLLSFVLIVESLLMSWEKWALILIALGVVISWIMHFRNRIPENTRLWIYSVLMMATFFFYGIHRTSTYDLAPVMLAVMMIFTMTGNPALIRLCMASFFVTISYEVVAMILAGEMTDELTISRTMLHYFLIVLGGWIAVTIIRKWSHVMMRSREEFNALEKSSQRMSDFMVNASHEFRTPINAVVGLSAIIEKEKLPTDVAKNVRAISRAGRQVSGQIGDILDFSEIDAGTLGEHKDNYRINALVNDLLVQLSQGEDYDLDLVIDMEAGIPAELRGDESRIKRILWHLITNGYKFTKTGGVFLHLYPIKRPYGINLVMEVRDTGIGMTDEEIDHAMERFYQSDSGRARHAGGLGLGLSIVSGFVESMGGVLTIESTPGEGTNVRVSIPQEVVNATPCLSVPDREKCSVAGFLGFITTADLRIREYYMEMVIHLSQGLGIPFHRVESCEELEKLVQGHRVTHLFVGTGEYLANREYVENLSRKMNVALVADRGYTGEIGEYMTLLAKPFYGAQVARFLNHVFDASTGKAEERMVCPGVRVLVADDEPMNLLVARGILDTYEMDVTTADSGQEAVDLCAKQDYDLIFMDHMMPGMDGVEAMKRIRANSGAHRKELRVIALTANVTNAAREMFADEGFDAFLAKPLEIVDLERVLKRLLPRDAIAYKKIRQWNERVLEEKPRSEDGLASLEDYGVDVARGLRYCQGDEGFYRQVLMKFAEDDRAKLEELERLFGTGNWKDYAIRTHTIKSTAKTIGALGVSEQARALEEAAKKEDDKLISLLHPSFGPAYAQLMTRIAAVVGKKETDSAQDEVMEFLPDGAADEGNMERRGG